MIKELVIHLGDTKTGSTSIQKALVLDACDTPGKTLIYPTRSNHVAMAKTLTKQRLFDQRGPRFRRLNTTFYDSDADYGIISAEHFQFVDPRVLAEAIDTYWPAFRDRLKLIAYVRPHADKLLSSFSERVKLGAPKTSLEDFFHSPGAIGVFRYTERFGQWREVFGDRFVLRPFVRSELYKGDAVADFLSTMLGSRDFTITREIAANTSLKVGQLALLREAHAVINGKIEGRKLPRYTEARSAIGRLTGEYLRSSALGADSAKLAIPAVLADPIRERYGPDAEALDAAFFEGTPMTDALAGIDSKLVDAPQSLEAADYFDADVLDSVRLFANVLGDTMANKPRETREAIAKARATAEAAD